MESSGDGAAARLRRALRGVLPRRRGETGEAPAPPAPPSGVPTPQQLSEERTGADPVWDC